jgi:predicted DNA-binding ribbon-helix-helix protein
MFPGQSSSLFSPFSLPSVYTRSRQIVVQHSVGLPAWYWQYLAQRAENEADTVTRLIRLAIEEKYPEIKLAKEIGL